MNWDFLDRPNSKAYLDFENKWWEKIGLRTEDKKGWNYGFIDGFDHAVYGLVLSAIWLPLGAATVLFCFGSEFDQAYHMRRTQSPQWWNPLTWHIGRHQDWVFPLLSFLVVAL